MWFIRQVIPPTQITPIANCMLKKDEGSGSLRLMHVFKGEMTKAEIIKNLYNNIDNSLPSVEPRNADMFGTSKKCPD